MAAEAYILDDLEATRARTFEEHFFDCTECTADVRDAAKIAGRRAHGNAVVPVKHYSALGRRGRGSGGRRSDWRLNTCRRSPALGTSSGTIWTTPPRHRARAGDRAGRAARSPVGVHHHRETIRFHRFCDSGGGSSSAVRLRIVDDAGRRLRLDEGEDERRGGTR